MEPGNVIRNYLGALARDERGFSTLQFIVGIAISAVFLAGGLAFAQSLAGGQIEPSLRTFTSALDLTRAVAASNGDLGATLTITPTSGNGFSAVVYPYRPITSTGVSLTTAPVASGTFAGRATVTAPSIGTTFSVFVAKSGAIQYANWTPAAGYYAPTACTTDLAITISVPGGGSNSKNISCSTALLQ